MASVFLWLLQQRCQASTFVNGKKRNKPALSMSKRSYVVQRSNAFLNTLSYFNLVFKSYYYRLQKNFHSLLLFIWEDLQSFFVRNKNKVWKKIYQRIRTKELPGREQILKIWRFWGIIPYSTIFHINCIVMNHIFNHEYFQKLFLIFQAPKSKQK